METLLNLVWLAVTVAAIWLWRFRWTKSEKNPRYSRRMEIGAMVCALALLFPVISLTDDLHPEVVPADTVSSKRNHCLLIANGSQAGNSKSGLNVHFLYALISHSAAGVEFAFEGLVPAPAIPHLVSASTAGFGRSPPSLG